MGKLLRVIAGRDNGKIFPLTEGQPCLIGRDLGTNTRLKDPHVAMLHCQVVVEGDRVVLADRGSSGGTFVNNARVTECELKAGDVLKVGDTRIRLDEAAPV